MRQLIEKLRSEKTAIEKEKKGRYESEAEGREQAYNAGTTVAKNWIKNSSYGRYNMCFASSRCQR